MPKKLFVKMIPALVVLLALTLFGSSCVFRSAEASVTAAAGTGDTGEPQPVLSVQSDILPPMSYMGYFARYEGIDGESQDAEHDKWIEIQSIDWGAHQPDMGSSGISRRRGGAEVGDFTVTFLYEKAATKLAEKCLRGSIIPKLEIELTTMSGEASKTFLKYEMQNVMISSYDVTGNREEGVPPLVTVSNNFEEIKVTYTEYDNEGNPKGNTDFTYNVETGR
jgi:type VI secretion system secreted protein Hcp